jgi:transposase
VRVGLETGPLAIWHVHGLRRLQVSVVCLDARYAHAVLACRPHKSDRNDARGLAELVRLGAYREVAIKSAASVRRRALLTARSRLVAMRRDVENQIRGLLKTFGRLIGAARGRGFEARVRDLIAEDAGLATLITPLLRVHGQLAREAACSSATSSMRRGTIRCAGG